MRARQVALQREQISYLVLAMCILLSVIILGCTQDSTAEEIIPPAEPEPPTFSPDGRLSAQLVSFSPGLLGTVKPYQSRKAEFSYVLINHDDVHDLQLAGSFGTGMTLRGKDGSVPDKEINAGFTGDLVVSMLSGLPGDNRMGGLIIRYVPFVETPEGRKYLNLKDEYVDEPDIIDRDYREFRLDLGRVPFVTGMYNPRCPAKSLRCNANDVIEDAEVPE